MALVMQKPKGKVKDFGLPKQGMQMARIVRILDLGLQPQAPYQGEEKQPAYMMRVTFELPKDRIEIDGETRPRWIDTEIKVSGHEKSKCYQYYNVLDPDNKYKGDWAKLIGVAAQIQISHRTSSQGKTFANVANVVPLMDGLEVPALENPTSVFDITSPDIELFQSLPDWLQNKIKENLEYEGSKLQRLLDGQPVPATASTGNPLDEEAEVDTKAKAPEIDVNIDDFDDDDVPF